MEILKIIKSTQAQKILVYFFTNPQKKHYVRELAVILGEDPGNLSRTLKELGKEGVLKVNWSGKQKFFGLNKTYPLFVELKRMIDKTIGVSGTLKKELSKVGRISQAFIYGSWAKRESSFDSDIDLFLVGKFDEDALLKVIARLEEKFGREINYTFFSPKEFQKAKKTNSFVQGVIKGPKIMILGNKNDL